MSTTFENMRYAIFEHPPSLNANVLTDIAPVLAEELQLRLSCQYWIKVWINTE